MLTINATCMTERRSSSKVAGSSLILKVNHGLLFWAWFTNKVWDPLQDLELMFKTKKIQKKSRITFLYLVLYLFTKCRDFFWDKLVGFLLLEGFCNAFIILLRFLTMTQVFGRNSKMFREPGSQKAAWFVLSIWLFLDFMVCSFCIYSLSISGT